MLGCCLKNYGRTHLLALYPWLARYGKFSSVDAVHDLIGP